MIRSGYSSRILEMSRVPIPDPVPPPSEWVSWKPCCNKEMSQSITHHSTSFDRHRFFTNYLKAVAAFGLFTDDIENRVDQLCSFGVMTFGPVVASSALSEYEIVGAEELSEWSRTDRIHSAGLQIDKDSPWDVLATASLIVVHIDTLQLKLRLAVVSSVGLDSVFVGNNFPELEFMKKAEKNRKCEKLVLNFRTGIGF